VLQLSSQLLVKCKTQIDELRKFREDHVPKHIILQLVNHCIIPATNYGAFYDDPESKDDYK